MKIKKFFAIPLALCLLLCATSSFTASANTTSWSSTYGSCTGYSFQSSWQKANSPVYKQIFASTTCAQAVPNISASAVGYLNGNQVMATGEVKQTDSTSAHAEVLNINYSNVTLTGNGTHAIWSSTLTRVNHFSYF